jgi:stage V sporulation protein B
MKNKRRSFVGGAVILGAVGILIKALGAVFRIPLANIIGDDGMGYYQTAYPIYVLFLTIATAGIPTAVSRMVAERYAKDKPYEAYRVFRTSSKLLFATGLVSASILFFGAGAITSAIKEPDAIYCMRAIAPALIFVPLMGSYRGFFQGRQDMRPTATSQFVEQLFRVICGLALTVILLPKGLPMAAAGASFGATAGGFFGFLAMLVIYFRNKAGIEAEISTLDRTPDETTASIVKTIIFIAVPITIGASIMPIITSIDTALVKSRLMTLGYSSAEARALYGQLTGMAQPIINLPQVLTQAVSVSLVPVIASSYKRGDTEFMEENIVLSIRYAMMIAMPCAFGLMVMSTPIMLMLYPAQPEAAVGAANCLEVLAVGVIFLSIVHATTGTLQGIGKQHIPVLNLVIGAVCKIFLTMTLTGIGWLNIRGAAVGTVAAYGVAAGLNLIAIKRYTGVTVGFTQAYRKPIEESFAMGLVASLLTYFLKQFGVGNAVACLIGIAAGAVVYVFRVFQTRMISIEELEDMEDVGDLKITRLLIKIYDKFIPKDFM